MSFLDRLDMLMGSRGINKKQLAKELNLTASTVYSWWSQGYEGITLPKLRKLCDYFGCTLDWLCCGNDNNPNLVILSPDESKLLNAFHAADPAIQAAVRKLLDLPESKESNTNLSAM